MSAFFNILEALLGQATNNGNTGDAGSPQPATAEATAPQASESSGSSSGSAGQAAPAFGTRISITFNVAPSVIVFPSPFFGGLPFTAADSFHPDANLMRAFMEEAFDLSRQTTRRPAAAKDVVAALPSVTKTAADTCVICQDNYSDGDSALQLPCKHDFHAQCIHPWLKENTTCPTCRYELKAEDPNAQQQANSASATVPAQSSAVPAPAAETQSSQQAASAPAASSAPAPVADPQPQANASQPQPAAQPAALPAFLQLLPLLLRPQLQRQHPRTVQTAPSASASPATSSRNDGVAPMDVSTDSTAVPASSAASAKTAANSPAVASVATAADVQPMEVDSSSAADKKAADLPTGAHEQHAQQRASNCPTCGHSLAPGANVSAGASSSATTAATTTAPTTESRKRTQAQAQLQTAASNSAAQPQPKRARTQLDGFFNRQSSKSSKSSRN